GVGAWERAAWGWGGVVEGFGVRVLKGVHARGHVSAGRVDEQMEVVSHRAARVDTPLVTIGHPYHELSKLFVVEVAPEEILGARRMAGDVVQPVGEARSRRPRHVSDVSS